MDKVTQRKKKTKKISIKLAKKRIQEYDSGSESDIASESGSESGIASDQDSERESDSGSEKNSERDPEEPQQQTAQQHQKSKKMVSIISKLVSQKQPILSKKRKLETLINTSILEQKAKKVLTAQKKLKRDVGRVKEVLPSSYEKTLRKVATRGVIQLFNALRQAQKQVNELQQDGIQKHVDQVPKVSKSVFLDALKKEQKVEFLKDDFGMAVDKHWDEE